MPGPPIVSVAVDCAVGESGSPEMDAPDGTSAPMSKPFGPAPIAGEPGRNRNASKPVPGSGFRVPGWVYSSGSGTRNPEVGTRNRGSSRVLPVPGKLVGSTDRSTVTFIVALV